MMLPVSSRLLLDRLARLGSGWLGWASPVGRGVFRRPTETANLVYFAVCSLIMLLACFVAVFLFFPGASRGSVGSEWLWLARFGFAGWARSFSQAD